MWYASDTIRPDTSFFTVSDFRYGTYHIDPIRVPYRRIRYVSRQPGVYMAKYLKVVFSLVEQMPTFIEIFITNFDDFFMCNSVTLTLSQKVFIIWREHPTIVIYNLSYPMGIASFLCSTAYKYFGLHYCSRVQYKYSNSYGSQHSSSKEGGIRYGWIRFAPHNEFFSMQKDLPPLDFFSFFLGFFPVMQHLPWVSQALSTKLIIFWRTFVCIQWGVRRHDSLSKLCGT